MDLRQLHCFLTLAEELHFGRAATRLFISQPTLSTQIQQLESEVGVRLFERTKRRVALTEPGKLFVQKAQFLLHEVQRTTTLLQKAGRGELGQVSVGFVEEALLTLLPVAVRSFRRDHPDVVLTFAVYNSPPQVEALQTGHIDLGLVRAPVSETGIELKPLLREPWIAALPCSHPLAKERQLTLRVLQEETIMFSSHQRHSACFDQFVRLCGSEGFTPQVMEEPVAFVARLGLVAAGMGIAMVAASNARLPFPGVVYRPIAAPVPVAELAVVTRVAENTPAVLAFRERLIATAQTFDGVDGCQAVPP